MKTVLYMALLSTMIGCTAPSGAGFAEEQNNAQDTADSGATVGDLSQYVDNVSASTFDAKNGWATDYVVLIDPTFQTADVDNLTFALYQWEQAVPVHFTTWMGACTTSGPGQICIHNYETVPQNQRPSTADGLTGYTIWSNDSADVYMFMSSATNTSVFYMTALHEEGHAQGLNHHNGPFVMNPCVNCYPSVDNITADDANQWFMLRGYPLIPEDAGLPN